MENHRRDNDGTLECEMKKGIPTTGEEKISYKSVYNGYWKCRDFELQHFWQRSVFLTAFLIACFAGYGGLVVAALECANLSVQKLTLVNGIGFAISLVGIVLSLLWIMSAGKMRLMHFAEDIKTKRLRILKWRMSRGFALVILWALKALTNLVFSGTLKGDRIRLRRSTLPLVICLY